MCGASLSQASHLSWICTLTLLPLGAITVYSVPQIGASFGFGPPPNSAYLHTITTMEYGIIAYYWVREP